ncbi:unnamed protein product, partial [Mesorhabditis spiculigera]
MQRSCHPGRLYRPFMRGMAIYKNPSLPRVPNDEDLYDGTVRFQHKQQEFELNTKWQDTMPSGSASGTVVTLHGSPGSHNDFKYITHYLRPMGIRSIGLNFPGKGFTDAHPDFRYDNDERDAYIYAMLDKIGVGERIIWLAHSRGNENALRCAVRTADKTKGLVLVNATGLQMHKGIRPHWVIQLAAWADRTNAVTRAVMNPITYFIYQRMGLLAPNQDVTAKCVQTMTTFEFSGLQKQIDQFNKELTFPMVQLMAGRDFLIEDHIVKEFFSKFANGEEKTLHPSSDDEEQAIEFVRERLNGGHRATLLNFPEDGHFLQKHRARLIAETCQMMLKN